MEEFKDVPGYEGLYQISNLGNVKSIRFNKEKILKQSIIKGYYLVTFRVYPYSKTYRVHQLVAMTFLGHKPCGFELVVDHIDSNKLNNNVNNLQLISQRLNIYKIKSKGSSKYKGVHWDKKNNKWHSQIRMNNKRVHIGYFNCELAASLAYQNKLKELI